MKSEWEFKFETRDFRFQKEHKFMATANEPVAIGDRPVERLEFLIRVVPSEIDPPPFVEQVGSLFITLPYSYDDTKSFAYHIAGMMAEQITFQSGDFRIHYGLVMCKRIAETPEEEEEFGDELYSAEVHLEEVLPAAEFNSTAFAQVPSNVLHPGLISQYNDTQRDSSPVRQFLGFFKIIESLYHSDDNKKTLKQAICTSSELRAVYESVVESGDFELFAKTIVDIRHRCAHLKLGSGFGYAPSDPAIESEVKPYLPLLAEMAYQCILSMQHSLK